MFQIRVEGLTEFTAAVQKMMVEADAASRAITVETAALVERQAKRNFAGSHRRGEPHVGGDRPNVVTGNLRRSIRTEPVMKIGPGMYGTRVGPTAIYGRRIELGYAGGAGRGHNRTRAFPYFEPAVRDTRARAQMIAVRRWGAVFGA